MEAHGYGAASCVGKLQGCHLLSSHQLQVGEELGKCEEQQTAGGRWPCAYEWGQLAEVPFSLCSGKLKMDIPLPLSQFQPPNATAE